MGHSADRSSPNSEVVLPLFQLTAACVGLLVFSAMILRGLWTGNAFDVVLGRAVAGLLGGTLTGALAGWLAQRVLQEVPSAPPEPAPVANPRDGGGPSGSSGPSSP